MGIVLAILELPIVIVMCICGWRAFNYPTKMIIDEKTGKMRIVDDPKYHYTDKELWEKPTYWNFDKNETLTKNK